MTVTRLAFLSVTAARKWRRWRCAWKSSITARLASPGAIPGPARAISDSGRLDGRDHAARALHQRFKAAVIAGLPEEHWSLTGDDLVRIFERMCGERPWLDRLAVLEDGPTVQIVDRYADHSPEFLTVVAIVPHDHSETNNEVVASLPDGSQLSL